MTFNCARCRQPLLLDDSIVDLNQSAYELVTGSLPDRDSSSSRHLSSNSSTPTEAEKLSRLHAQGDGPSPGSPSASSPGLSAGTQPTAAPLSSRLRLSVSLFNLLSYTTSLDHPLCNECADTVSEMMKRQMEEENREREAYITFEAEVKKAESGKDVKKVKETLKRDIERLKEEEARAIADLRQAEREKQDLSHQLAELDEEERALAEEEAEFWRLHSQHVLSLSSYTSELRSLQTSLERDSRELAKLQQTNVYNDAFCIGHDGGFATINGLRLGRLPGATVEWAEINAAWGQTVLLLHTLAKKLNFVFENFRLVPMGSFSSIEKISGDKATYELYGSGDLHLGRLFQNRRFDHAMVAFLDCLRQLMTWAQDRDPDLRLPHAINKDRIGEASIRLQFSQDETWTRALRHVLLTLKVLLSWAVNLDDES